MPYDPKRGTEACIVCGCEANLQRDAGGAWEHDIDCIRCGDFRVSQITTDPLPLLYTDPQQRALGSYAIRKLQASTARPRLSAEFFERLNNQSLPSPAELMDNFLIWLAQQASGRPGRQIHVEYGNLETLGVIGAVGPEEVEWAVNNLIKQGLVDGLGAHGGTNRPALLTAQGWQRDEQLKRAQVDSRYAFFARKFDNPELDQVYETCLKPTVAETGYELRTVPQRAGLIDAIIEDEIRRCKFLIADLSDDNAGAYWEAGFAEGLRKPVFYICRAKAGDREKATHFDTNHRHTVRWDLASLERTSTELKAVIRNTLLGDARQAE